MLTYGSDDCHAEEHGVYVAPGHLLLLRGELEGAVAAEQQELAQCGVLDRGVQRVQGPLLLVTGPFCWPAAQGLQRSFCEQPLPAYGQSNVAT